MWPFKNRPHSMHGVNYLDLVPRRLVDSEPAADDGKVRLLMPRYRDPLGRRLLQPLLRGERRFIRVPLEERGSWIWERVDGTASVGELAVGFREAFPEDGEQIEERVCQYVAALVGNGFLAVE